MNEFFESFQFSMFLSFFTLFVVWIDVLRDFFNSSKQFLLDIDMKLSNLLSYII